MKDARTTPSIRFDQVSLGTARLVVKGESISQPDGGIARVLLDGTLDFDSVVCNASQTRPLSSNVEAHLSTQQNLRFQFEVIKEKNVRLTEDNERLTTRLDKSQRELTEIAVENAILQKSYDDMAAKLKAYEEAEDMLLDSPPGSAHTE